MLVSAQGVRLNVDEAGAGETLLFLHGNASDLTSWEPQIDEFSRTHRTVALDLRGFGRSDRTYGRLSLGDYADDVAALIRALALPRPVVVGLSIGGMVAQELALREPGLVRALVVADSAASLDPPMREMMATAGRMALDGGMAALAAGFEEALFTDATRQSRPPWMTKFLSQFTSTDPFQYYLALQAAAELDLVGRLPTLKLPALVICGAEDKICPLHLSQALSAAIAKSRLVVLPDAGHMANLEQSKAFNATLRSFLGG